MDQYTKKQMAAFKEIIKETELTLVTGMEKATDLGIFDDKQGLNHHMKILTLFIFCQLEGAAETVEISFEKLLKEFLKNLKKDAHLLIS